jgi:hypothetical protein
MQMKEQGAGHAQKQGGGAAEDERGPHNAIQPERRLSNLTHLNN